MAAHRISSDEPYEGTHRAGRDDKEPAKGRPKAKRQNDYFWATRPGT